MSKNPFVNWLPYILGFSLSAVFVTILITGWVTDLVTKDVIDGFVEGCYVTFKDLPVNLESCVQKSNEVRSFEVLDKSICSGCGGNQLCLKEVDLKYCEEGFDRNSGLINLRTFLKTITNPFTQFSSLVNLLIVMGLFMVGFIIGTIIVLVR